MVPVGVVLLTVSVIKCLQHKCRAALPWKLQDWKWLPTPLRSLAPYDNFMKRACFCRRFQMGAAGGAAGARADAGAADDRVENRAGAAVTDIGSTLTGSTRETPAMIIDATSYENAQFSNLGFTMDGEFRSKNSTQNGHDRNGPKQPFAPFQTSGQEWNRDVVGDRMGSRYSRREPNEHAYSTAL
jgi:hypothetical protein